MFLEKIKRIILLKRIKVKNPETGEITLENEDKDKFLTINLTQNNTQIGKMRNVKPEE